MLLTLCLKIYRRDSKYKSKEKKEGGNEMRKQNGITLIALVITIIVLLILAGVSIAMLTGENGILTQATRAKERTEEAEQAERINAELNAIMAIVMEKGIKDLSDTETQLTEPKANAMTNLGTGYAMTSTADEIEITRTGTTMTGTITLEGAKKTPKLTKAEVPTT